MTLKELVSIGIIQGDTDFSVKILHYDENKDPDYYSEFYETTSDFNGIPENLLCREVLRIFPWAYNGIAIEIGGVKNDQ